MLIEYRSACITLVRITRCTTRYVSNYRLQKRGLGGLESKCSRAGGTANIKKDLCTDILVFANRIKRQNFECSRSDRSPPSERIAAPSLTKIRLRASVAGIRRLSGV